jgi:hypothetical protein
MREARHYLIKHGRTFYSATTEAGVCNRVTFSGARGPEIARLRYGRVQRTAALLHIVPEDVVFSVESRLAHARGCSTVGARYRGVLYEASDCDCCAGGNVRVASKGQGIARTRWKLDRLVRTPELLELAPRRVIGRLETRLRRLHELKAHGAYLANRSRHRPGHIEETDALARRLADDISWDVDRMNESLTPGFLDVPYRPLNSAAATERPRISLPWSHPDADPIADTQSVMRDMSEDAGWRGRQSLRRRLPPEAAPIVADEAHHIRTVDEIDVETLRPAEYLRETFRRVAAPQLAAAWNQADASPVSDIERLADGVRARIGLNFEMSPETMGIIRDSARRAAENIDRLAFGLSATPELIPSDLRGLFARQVAPYLGGPQTRDRTADEINSDAQAERNRAADEGLQQLADGIRGDAASFRAGTWLFVHRLDADPDPLTGSAESMAAISRQVSDATAEVWADAWGCTPDELPARCLEFGEGGAVPAGRAAEISKLIIEDVGADTIEGARRADRGVYDRHTDPDTTGDLDHHDEDQEPLEDVEWLRDLMAETERGD